MKTESVPMEVATHPVRNAAVASGTHSQDFCVPNETLDTTGAAEADLTFVWLLTC